MRLLLFGFIALAAVLVGDPASAERRVALVIGNSDYIKAPRLVNPINDAGAMVSLLKTAGFDKVVQAHNLGAAQMRRAFRDFSDEVRDADIAVVFYAGHGMEINGTNYLIPVDAILERDIDIADEAISLERINQVLEQAKRLRLIILDACRDNPFVHSMRRTLAGRSIGRGLAPVEVATTDTLIAYAAKAGLTAADGDGANSPYTVALIKHLATPGLDVRLSLGRVRDEVLRTTSRRQEPFVYGSLGGAEVPLIAGSRPRIDDGAPVSAVTSAWDRIKETNEPAVLEAFISRFGDTFFGDLAKARLVSVRQERERIALQQQQEEEGRKKVANIARTARVKTLNVVLGDNGQPRLGVKLSTLPPRWANAIGIGERGAAIITEFSEGSAAARGGLLVWDALLAIDSIEVKSPAKATLLLKERSPASTTRIEVWQAPHDIDTTTRNRAEKGDVASAGLLGFFYERGIYVAKNEREAAIWFRKAAEAGDAAAMGYLGSMLAEGRGGLAKNAAEAVQWYRRGAAGGDLLAIQILIEILDEGRGQEPNFDEAAEWVVRGIKAGSDYILDVATDALVTQSQSWNIATRKKIQERLRSEGLYSGAIDGIWGPNTIEAIKKLATSS